MIKLKDYNQLILRSFIQMIRTKPANGLIQQKPRKMLKLDLFQQKQYNQFEGNSQIDQQLPPHPIDPDNHLNSHPNKHTIKYQSHFDVDTQINKNKKIFQLISHSHLKLRKVTDPNQQKKKPVPESNSSKLIKKQTKSLPSVKFEEGTEPPTLKTEHSKQEQSQKKNQIKQKPKHFQPSSNWKKFLQNSKIPKNSVQKTQRNIVISNSSVDGEKRLINEPSKFVAIDCEFVKCGQSEELARISIVSENSETLYDSYIKPQTKISDFLVQITGITYSHIKQAPKWSQEITKVKKILMGKIIVGHTLEKDLEVTKLSNWKGISQKINIANFSEYREKGGSKIVSLKRMALSFLNRNIQSGWHSSVEDAVTTMDLFKLKKKKILKEFKLI